MLAFKFCGTNLPLNSTSIVVCAKSSLAVVLDVLSTAPATVRPQTPPPSCSGAASPRAHTNADEGERNAVLTVFIVDISALSEEPTPSGTACWSGVGGTAAIGGLAVGSALTSK